MHSSRKQRAVSRSTRLASASVLFITMLSRYVARAFQPSFLRRPLAVPPLRSPQSRLLVHTDRLADNTEMMIGGERYEMCSLPDSMLDTTLWVGNLCEFAHDADLSKLFQSVSSLNSVPACVARKPDMNSMEYGFVSFPNVQEKEAAIIKYNGYEWRGKRLKVEPIQDLAGRNRVRVPGKMVAYVIGEVKKTRSGKPNNLRRISRDDVDRLSRGQPSKKKGYGSRNVPHRLNDKERSEIDRAAKKGFVTLAGAGNRRTRKGSPLANIHRQWCDARDKPHILLFKAVGGRSVDQLIVDLAPLRLNGLFDDPGQVDEFLSKWKTDILTAASNSGMGLSCESDDDDDDAVNDDAEDVADEEPMTYDDDDAEDDAEYMVTLDSNISLEAWATSPIWKLPMVSIGTFEGERSKAKAMAKELAILWAIPEETKGDGAKSRKAAGAPSGGKTKVKGLSAHRKRGGGHRQAW